MPNINYFYISIILCVVSSNYLVLFPINDWLTWGAFTYPVSYLINELSNKMYGPQKTKRIVFIGFGIGILLSIWCSTPKIAFASSTAFLISQLLNIKVFNLFRYGKWWQGPMWASLLASMVDSFLFWNLAFWGESVPLLTWALGDTLIKVTIDLMLLTPFRIITSKIFINGHRNTS